MSLWKHFILKFPEKSFFVSKLFFELICLKFPTFQHLHLLLLLNFGTTKRNIILFFSYVVTRRRFKISNYIKSFGHSLNSRFCYPLRRSFSLSFVLPISTFVSSLSSVIYASSSFRCHRRRRRRKRFQRNWNSIVRKLFHKIKKSS